MLNFFNRLIPILTAEQIITELNPTNICFLEEEIRLCDYNLLFYPRNLRSDAEGLEQRYLREAGQVVFELLSLMAPSNSMEHYGDQV